MKPAHPFGQLLGERLDTLPGTPSLEHRADEPVRARAVHVPQHGGPGRPVLPCNDPAQAAKRAQWRDEYRRYRERVLAWKRANPPAPKTGKTPNPKGPTRDQDH